MKKLFSIIGLLALAISLHAANFAAQPFINQPWAGVLVTNAGSVVSGQVSVPVYVPQSPFNTVPMATNTMTVSNFCYNPFYAQSCSSNFIVFYTGATNNAGSSAGGPFSDCRSFADSLGDIQSNACLSITFTGTGAGATGNVVFFFTTSSTGGRFWTGTNAANTFTIVGQGTTPVTTNIIVSPALLTGAGLLRLQQVSNAGSSPVVLNEVDLSGFVP